ncbi:ion transport protein domain-containing protein [Ditylenchus destructor]|uniref:Ion transport protein domain-containing protein n=1 Tax=Ditylenchus destructor TaxID=166010 RepID=A0AAD4RAU0_9BILA|nr:ion transport protein domain-containing protein [Ditylenchus destructor]
MSSPLIANQSSLNRSHSIPSFLHSQGDFPRNRDRMTTIHSSLSSTFPHNDMIQADTNLDTIRSGFFGASTSTATTARLAGARRRSSGQQHDVIAKTLSERLSETSWIERVFQRRECIKFIPEQQSDRCGCGRLSSHHSQLALSRFTTSVTRPSAVKASKKWTIGSHTTASPTDAFGIIEFQGGTHAHKAHYIRLAFDSNPADVMHLMEKVWNLQRPRLVITIHGGMSNFKVADKLGRLFREGMLKAAETTGAWIITSGIDSGVVRHVARALDEAGISARMRSKVVTIGIAPWGLLRRREKLLGKEAHVTYDRHYFSDRRSRYAVLNDRHSYFLLVDNGTVGRYGADIVLRKCFEDFLAKKQTLYCGGNHRIPIVCVTLEGGLCTLNSIHQYLTSQPAIPVIICEGSGRVSDLLAIAEQNQDQEGNLPQNVRGQILDAINTMLCYDNTPPEAILEKIMKCVRFSGLLTVFRLHEDSCHDVDHVILRALLKGQNLSPADQLSLTLAWDRVDIAKAEIFQDGQEWPMQSLYSAMFDALILNRVEFVQLLLENGVSMKKFLTIGRLEQLYNAEPEHLSTLYHLIGDKPLAFFDGSEGFTLPEIGVAVEKLMGNAYRCHYTTRDFKTRYEKYKGKTLIKRSASIGNLHLRLTSSSKSFPVRRKRGTQEKEHSVPDATFRYPFNDLMLWAVLTRRHEMAKCMWQHGEEAMAKALIAIRLYKCMSKEAADDYTEVEVSNLLREYANEFRECSYELLSHCYQQDDFMTMRLLTAEMPNWGNHTCLSLAVTANNKRFLAHPCCQILLAELWHGGLRFRSQSNVKVVLAVLFPPTILLLDFKTFAQQRTNGNTSTRAPNEVIDDHADERDHQTDIVPDHTNFGSYISSFLGRKSSITHLITRNGVGKNLVRQNSDEESTELMSREAATHNNKRVHIMESKFSSQENATLNASRKTHGAEDRRKSKVWKRWLHDCVSKFVLFYRAPITSFWIWSISFGLFMLLLIYVLLIEFPPEVSWAEWLIFAYVIGLGLEHFRKLLILESSSFMEKMRVFYYNRYWNILTSIAVLTYFIGFALRFHKPAVHTWSRVILASNSLLWHMKLFDFLSVHPRIGPYITMAGKMVLAMSYIIVMLLVTLMAFGVVRQSIAFPHEKWNWILVRNIFYKPYFMLYGEVYAGEIDTCGDEGTNCVPGGWIPPFVMVIFLLVANILLINMLIAIFNNIFNVTNAMSQQVWMFQRYEQVLEYRSTPIVPPPLTPLVHLAMFFRYLCKGNTPHVHSSNSTSDFAIKVYLEENEMKKLRDFEEDCMDYLSRRKLHCSSLDQQNQLKDNVENLEQLSSRIKDLIEENTTLKSNFNHLLNRFERFELLQRTMAEFMMKGSSESEEAPEPTKESVPLMSETASRKSNLPKAHVTPLPSQSDRRNFSDSTTSAHISTLDREIDVHNNHGYISNVSDYDIFTGSYVHEDSPPTSPPGILSHRSSYPAARIPSPPHARFSLYDDDDITIDAHTVPLSSTLESRSPCGINTDPAIEAIRNQKRQRHSVSLTEDLEQMFIASGFRQNESDNANLYDRPSPSVFEIQNVNCPSMEFSYITGQGLTSSPSSSSISSTTSLESLSQITIVKENSSR